MDRTLEFRRYLEQASVPVMRREVPRLQRKEPSVNVVAVKTRLQQAMMNMERLSQLITHENLMGENDIEITNLTGELSGELDFIKAQIDRMQASNASPEMKAFANSFGRTLKELADQFKQTLIERNKIETEATQRRSRLGAVAASSTFQAAYDDDDDVEIPMGAGMAVQTEQRRQDVQGIESQVEEIYAQVAKLGEIIADQDFTIMRIAENAEEAVDNMKRGEEALLQYYQKVKGNKWLMLKIFAVLIVFALIFILVI